MKRSEFEHNSKRQKQRDHVREIVEAMLPDIMQHVWTHLANANDPTFISFAFVSKSFLPLLVCTFPFGLSLLLLGPLLLSCC
jgi:hypothetical protein